MSSSARSVTHRPTSLCVLRSMPLSPIGQRLVTLGTTLLVLWLLAVIAGPAWLAHSDLALNAHGHAPLHARGHPFVDTRSLWGVPNFMDVWTNLAMGVAGLLGGWGLLRGGPWAPGTRLALAVFFGGLLATGFGSAWYHWAPDAHGLVLDRMGMAVTFSGALALAVAERVGQKPAACVMRLTLVVALLSAAMPLTHGNVLPWAVVQFGGMALMAWLALHKPRAGALGVRLGVLIGLYALAKLLELGDEAVFHATGDVVSGHSLKHLVAGLAAWPVLRAVRQNARATGRGAAPSEQ
ncbi:MAG: hypothetical protein Q8L16_07335 [Hydrogenophaga sp.]|nr:hypothetical protein [Hydrogenophaga sp.]